MHADTTAAVTEQPFLRTSRRLWADAKDTSLRHDDDDDLQIIYDGDAVRFAGKSFSLRMGP
jgi:hypothetical protein